MSFAEKILKLRKSNGMSQDELAEKLNVSRQAISRWEMGTAQPDAQNILQISKLFNVTTDYLLYDEYESNGDIPAVQTLTQESEKFFQKKKLLPLVAAIAFTIAAFCFLIIVVNGVTGIQLGFSCFALVLCTGNAAAQFILYFKKR